ncbi:MAG TPA: alpha/beta hydrolase [Tepidisphaeraceae bacterium]|nr:alpha/beta hydrolase [Tepidisphaeraceae bacterium]
MLIAGITVLVILVLAGFLFWQFMSAPLYTPGMVRAGKNLRAPLDPPMPAGDASYWQVEDDIRLFFTTQGQGRPILVVHGGPGYPVHGPLVGLESLTSTYKLFCYDQRGCGKSTKPFDRFASKNYYSNMKDLERTLGIGAQVADIERIRRILGQEKLILMGHSFGGFLATMYASEFPDHVEALVLVAPAGVLLMPDQEAGFFEEIRKRLPSDRHAEYDQFVKEYLDFGSIFSKSEIELAGMNRRVGEYFLTASGREGEVGQPKVPEDNGGWVVQALYFSMGKQHDYRPALKTVKVPALIVLGEGDVIPEHGSRMYADYLPNSRLHVMKNGRTRGGHFPFSEQPEEFARVVGDFLARK